LIKSFTEYSFWHSLSSSGTVSSSVYYADLLSFAIADSLLMLTFMALATGWCVTRLELSYSEWRMIAAYIVFFFMAKTGWDLSTSIAFSFLLLAANFLIIFWVLKHTRMNLEILFMRLHVTFHETENEVSARIMNQFSIIRRFRGVVVSFVCFLVLVRGSCVVLFVTAAVFR
jgi:hypothetical protein